MFFDENLTYIEYLSTIYILQVRFKIINLNP